MPRAPRMLKLVEQWYHLTDEAFCYDNLTNAIEYNGRNVGHRNLYTNTSVRISESNVIILETYRYQDDQPRTKIYNEDFSDRLDRYMDALEVAIKKRKAENAERSRLEYERHYAKVSYEENLF